MATKRIRARCRAKRCFLATFLGLKEDVDVTDVVSVFLFFLRRVFGVFYVFFGGCLGCSILFLSSMFFFLECYHVFCFVFLFSFYGVLVVFPLLFLGCSRCSSSMVFLGRSMFFYVFSRVFRMFYVFFFFFFLGWSLFWGISRVSLNVP